MSKLNLKMTFLQQLEYTLRATAEARNGDANIPDKRWDRKTAAILQVQ
jgi:hypothetical protein